MNHLFRRVIRRAISGGHHLLLACQRLSVLVFLGLVMILVSHFPKDAAERAWLRDTGGVVVGAAFAKWVTAQGARRRKPDGTLLRKNTIRFDPEEAERIRKHLERNDR